MEESDKIEQNLKIKKEEAKEKVTGLVGGLKEFLSVLLDIKSGTDKPGTVQTIKDGISMQGHTSLLHIALPQCIHSTLSFVIIKRTAHSKNSTVSTPNRLKENYMLPLAQFFNSSIVGEGNGPKQA